MSISTGIYVATALFLAIGSNPAQSAQPSILKYGTVDGWTVQTNGWLCQAAAFHKADNILLIFIAWADPENGERLWTLFLKNEQWNVKKAAEYPITLEAPQNREMIFIGVGAHAMSGAVPKDVMNFIIAGQGKLSLKLHNDTIGTIGPLLLSTAAVRMTVRCVTDGRSSAPKEQISGK